MTNNDIFRRLRYLFNYNETKMIEIFNLVDHKVNKEEIRCWLKKEDDLELEELTDRELDIFLNGLIIEKRGRREGPLPTPEEHLTNNMIIRKLKITFKYRSEDILDLFKSIDKQISKHELSAFFRHPDSRNYEECGDQYLRYFLNALQHAHRKKPTIN